MVTVQLLQLSMNISLLICVPWGLLQPKPTRIYGFANGGMNMNTLLAMWTTLMEEVKTENGLHSEWRWHTRISCLIDEVVSTIREEDGKKF